MTELVRDTLGPTTVDVATFPRRTFEIYRFVSRGYFYLPLLVAAFHVAGASTLAVGGLLAVYGVSVMLAPRVWHPSGTRASSGRLAVGEVARAGGLAVTAIGLALTPRTVGWALVVASQVIGGVGFGIGAGQDSKILRARMRTLQREEEFGGLEGKTQSLAFVSVFVSGFIGVGLFQIDKTGPFVAGAAIALVSALLARRLDPDGTASDDPPATAKRPALVGTDRAVALLYAAVRGSALTLFIFLLPVLLVIGAKARALPLVAVLAAFSISAFLAGRRVGQVMRRAADRGRSAAVAALAVAVVVVALVLVGVSGVVGGDLVWVLAPLAAVTGGLGSALARPVCFGALSVSGAAQGATAQAERICSGANTVGTVAAAVALESLGRWGWAVITGVGALAVLAAGLRALASWPVTPRS